MTHGKRPAPGRSAKNPLRLKRPLLRLFSCVPPIQSWFATSAGAPSGTRTIAETRFSGPCPEFCVSQVVVSGATANTLATDVLARSTTLTCAWLSGSSVR